jgi:hypothetical protein
MEKLSRRNDFKLYTLTTPVGTSTTNSRQSATIPELAGAREIVVVVKTTDDGQAYQHHFIDVGAGSYYDCFYGRVPDNNYSYVYDIIWNQTEYRVSIRFNYKGTNFNGTPKIYAVMYR